MRLALIFVLFVLFSACAGEVTDWNDNGPPPCYACPDVLVNTLWFKEIDGQGWEWLFKESNYLAGHRGFLLTGLSGIYRTDGKLLEIADEGCYYPTGEPIIGAYTIAVGAKTMDLQLVEDDCAVRARGVTGRWERFIYNEPASSKYPSDSISSW